VPELPLTLVQVVAVKVVVPLHLQQRRRRQWLQQRRQLPF